MIMEEITHYLLWSVFFTAIAILFLRRRTSRDLPLPPGPRTVPVLGNLLQLGQNPPRSLARLAQIYGPVMYLKLGSIQTVVISSPSSAKQVLKTKEQSFSGRQVPDVVRGLNHHETSWVWSSRNESWRYLRNLTKTHLFNTQSLDATQQLRRRKVQELVAYIKGKKGEALHIGRTVFCVVLNMISNTIFSTDLVDFNSAQEFKDLLSSLMEEAGKPNLSDFFPLLAPMDFQGRRRRFTAHYKKLRDFFEQMIENRLAATEGEGRRTKQDFLDAILQQNREDSSKLSRKTINTLLIVINCPVCIHLEDSFVGGTETTTSAMEWALAELLRRPDLLRKARNEIMTVVGFAREVEESDMSSLPFLQAVLKETFRLHPPAPFLLPYKAEESAEINGYMVPKNSQVLVNVWAIGRDERVWKNADCFAPERFMDGEEIDFRGHQFELLPFGSGRRICPGLPLGVRMVQLVLASLIQSFEWSLPDGMKPGDLDLTEKFGLTFVLASPLLAMASTPTQF